MGKVIERGKRRRAKQRKKEKAKPQFYGGSKERAEGLARWSDAGIERGDQRVDEGMDTLNQERRQSFKRMQELRGELTAQRENTAAEFNELDAEAAARGAAYNERDNTYGQSADRSLGDYRSGRGAILSGADKLENNDWMKDYQAGRGDILSGASRLESTGATSGANLEAAGGRSADMLEGFAQGAAGEYTSAADAAFQAAQNRNQKNALALAAGRGAGSIRTALATSDASTQQAALDQQVVKAQEANAINAMRNQAVADAAGIRMSGIEGGAGLRMGGIQGGIDARTGLSAQDLAAAEQRAANTAQAAAIRTGVGGMDQQAAALEAGRQEAARQAALATTGQRADIRTAGSGLQRDLLGLVQQGNQADTAVGVNVGATQVGAGETQRGAFLGSQDAQAGAQLGANVQTELQRAEAAKANDSLTKAKKWTNVTTLGILG
jgi:hypothetical protein